MLVGHMDSGFCDTTETLLYVEDTYDVGLPVLPYASLGVGYLWAVRMTATRWTPCSARWKAASTGHRASFPHRRGRGVLLFPARCVHMDKNGQSDDHNLGIQPQPLLLLLNPSLRPCVFDRDRSGRADPHPARYVTSPEAFHLQAGFVRALRAVREAGGRFSSPIRRAWPPGRFRPGCWSGSTPG
ncbi:MAG: hypothetical protein U1F87_08070 [Kiritimatiellia bacterium]